MTPTLTVVNEFCPLITTIEMADGSPVPDYLTYADGVITAAPIASEAITTYTLYVRQTMANDPLNFMINEVTVNILAVEATLAAELAPALSLTDLASAGPLPVSVLENTDWLLTDVI